MSGERCVQKWAANPPALAVSEAFGQVECVRGHMA